MYNSNIPNDRELPSTSKLIKSTIFAIIASLILLVTVVMPAEYGIDPTGVGQVIGLKKMGEIRISLEEEAKDDLLKEASALKDVPELITKPIEQTSNIQTDEITFTLTPNQGTEIKVDMIKGAKTNYSWKTNGGTANFDVHGDSKTLKIKYHNYTKGINKKSDEGIIIAAFDGSHGWFWRNRTDKDVKIILKIYGQYTNFKHFK